MSANLYNPQYVNDLHEAGIISEDSRTRYLGRIKSYREYLRQMQQQYAEANVDEESEIPSEGPSFPEASKQNRIKTQVVDKKKNRDSVDREL